MSENTRFVEMVGGGALRLWPDLPRDVQERLFEEAVRDDEALRQALAPLPARPPSSHRAPAGTPGYDVMTLPTRRV